MLITGCRIHQFMASVYVPICGLYSFTYWGAASGESFAWSAKYKFFQALDVATITKVLHLSKGRLSKAGCQASSATTATGQNQEY